MRACCCWLNSRPWLHSSLGYVGGSADLTWVCSHTWGSAGCANLGWPGLALHNLALHCFPSTCSVALAQSYSNWREQERDDNCTSTFPVVPSLCCCHFYCMPLPKVSHVADPESIWERIKSYTVKDVATRRKKTKTLIRKDTCTPMFNAALFTIAKMWKQPKRPSTDEWIKKMWMDKEDIYIVVY